ncbi:MAG TPA: CocE/NonD family hydrolase [Caulobacterales bacterium]|nr:CocE/NonD family hydrolase [Caulobacterales bacterium]
MKRTIGSFLYGALLAMAGAASAPQAMAQTPTAAVFNAYRPAPAFSETSTTSFYLPMRDGVKVAMQVVRPAKDGKTVEGKFPVVWQAGLGLPGPPNPNLAPERALGDWSRLVKQGYVVVDVARRAAGPSFGIRRGYHDREEAYDAYEITEWLAKQPWSNGMVGMHGCSNTGEAVMHALSVAPPHLKAAWAGCFSWSKYDGFLRGGGIIANWGSGPTRTVEEDMKERPVDGDESRTLLAQAAREHLQSVDLFALLKSIPYRDSWSPLTRSRFAVEGSTSAYALQLANANIPLYIQGGWYDDFRKEGLIALANMPNTHIVIGPWTHCANTDFDLIGEAQRFFDHYLKGVDTGIERDDPIHYFVVGAAKGQEWRAAKTWPSVTQNALSLYLAKGALAARKPGGGGQAAFTANYNTACAVKQTTFVTNLQPCHPQTGAVSFQGPKLQRATELTGHPIVKVWVSSSNTKEARVFAYLEDVAPDGSVKALTEGRQSVALRKLATPPWKYYDLPWRRSYAEDGQPLKTGEAVEVVIDMLPLSYIVPAGHRIQLSVAGADPRERVRPDGEPPALTVYFGGNKPSSLSLPARAS